MGNKEHCWLCEDANSNKLIGYCGDDSFSIGRDKTNEVGFWTTTRYGVVCTHNKIYSPKFCPECGRSLKEENKEMEPNIITYGVCNETFYVIQGYGAYYDIWWVDEIPIDMTIKGIKNFMEEFSLDGCSVSGSYKEVMKELANLILDLT